MPYYVYVVELDKVVLKSKKFRERNPGLNPHCMCYYVGQSVHNPVTRFQQHRDGYKANRFVQRYGIRLAWEKFQGFNPVRTRGEAEVVEQRLARRLRRRGYGVWSN
jgi:predicted GIY-YIG superfamily endonuclease